MTVLFKNAQIIDPEGDKIEKGSVFVEGQKIKELVYGGTPDLKAKEVVDCGGNYLAPGIIDIGVKVGEPGERHKESFASVGKAAAAGGVTTIVIRPDTEPAVDSPEALEFINRRAQSDCKISVLPLAALTKGRAGQEMAELGFLQDAGAVAFSDGDQVITDNKIFARCLTYAKSLDALVITHAQEPSLSKGAAATSGHLATKLGLPAVSPMAERLQMQRDMTLAEMTGTRIHVDQLSTRAALPILERAKGKGLPVTAGASIHHLTLTEKDIETFATFFKLKPPLRADEDRQMIVNAVANGVIDVISSMHTPQDEESKRLPFEEAASGAVALETLLPAALSLVDEGAIKLPALWRALSSNPAKLLDLPSGRMETGAPADLVLFDANHTFMLDRSTLNSKSKNTPFDGREMKGRVLKTYHRGQEVYSA